jgi:Ca2+-binding EF-hand superfamily protein
MVVNIKAQPAGVLAPTALSEHESWKHDLFRSSLSPGASELSLSDLKGVLSKLHLPDSRVSEVFARADSNGDGRISYEEFSSYVDRHELELRTAFAAIDTDGSGTISASEVQALLDRMQMACSPARRDEILKAIDTDGDGTISYPEYRSFFALLDPEDLLRSLDEKSSFGDLPVGMTADLFRMAGAPAPAILRSEQRLKELGTNAERRRQDNGTLEAARQVMLQLVPGGIAGAMAQTIVQPVETLKVRLQAESAGTAPPRYGSMLNALRLVTSEEGSLALWKGMVPSALRELSYSTLRFGLYKPIKTALGAGTPRDTPVWKMMAAGGAAGGIASFIANPTDLLKTRMQADAGLVPQSMAAHMSQIYQQSGVLGFWRGASATVARAVTLGAVKMASYDATKIVAEDRLGWNKGTLPNTLISCLVSSGFVVASSAPIDFLRTQMMAGKETGGMLSIATKAIRAHGPLVLWRGWVPQYMRILPYGTLQFIFMERIANALGASMT